MATIITAKILKATTTDGVATILVELDDGKGKWTKTYTQQQESVKLADFQKMIEGDVKKDLKVPTQLSEITPMVGKTFTFTV